MLFYVCLSSSSFLPFLIYLVWIQVFQFLMKITWTSWNYQTAFSYVLIKGYSRWTKRKVKDFTRNHILKSSTLNLLGPRGNSNVVLLPGTTKDKGNSEKVSIIQSRTMLKIRKWDKASFFFPMKFNLIG